MKTAKTKQDKEVEEQYIEWLRKERQKEEAVLMV